MPKLVLIGAGSSQFGLSAMGDIFQKRELENSEVVLHDIDEVALDKVYQLGLRFLQQNSVACRLTATTERSKALEGADFIVISIEVGARFVLWEADRTIPQQFGMQQIYGENGGVGGIFHALRIIPLIMEICADIAEICPAAYVFNYSNPMTKICTTVCRKYPQLKFFGLCHEIASLESYIPQILGVDWDELECSAGGLNHFSFLLDIHYKSSGKDAYPDLRAKAPPFFRSLKGYTDFLAHYRRTGEFTHSEGKHTVDDRHVAKISAEWADRGVFSVFLQQYGYLPITVDSHLGEYLSWAHDVADHRSIIDFLTWYKIELSTASKSDIKMEEKERFASIIAGLISDNSYVESAINLPNQGLIAGLPDSLVVEVPASVSATGIRGLPLENYPVCLRGLLQNQVAVNDLVAEAVLQKSRKYVAYAILADPVTHQCRDLDRIISLFIDTQAPHLDYLG